MMEALAAQGVVHAEVYVSVGVVYYWRNIEFEPLFAGMERGRLRGEKEFGVSLFGSSTPFATLERKRRRGFFIKLRN